MRPRLILAGGGHSHLLVLECLAASREADIDVSLVSESRWQYYSGMLPGLMAGHYRLNECRVDLQSLCQHAGCNWVEARIAGLDSAASELVLQGGERLGYERLSLAVGSQIDTRDLTGLGNRLLAVKPFATFIQRWSVIVETAARQPGYQLAVIGAGAAAVELALSARFALPQSARVTLVAGEEGVLPALCAAARKKIRAELASAQIRVLPQRARGEEGYLRLDNDTLPLDAAIAATGAAALPWLTGSGLAVDEQGFVMVDASHRSISDARVFASGDVCSRRDVDLARSGVQAVRVSPTLSHNLLASLRGGALRDYQPRRYSLYLLACGRRYAVGAFGPLAFAGRWVWHWKNHIDRKFIRRLQK